MLVWRRTGRPWLVWARRWLGQRWLGQRWLGQRPLAAPVSHAPAQLGAWEAELTAYAHWRTGNPALKVRFGLATGVGWAEEVHLLRPTGTHPPAQVLAAAEVELEHLLAHHCYGWRELTLLWHAWAAAAAPITLPWPPWDRVGLPPAVIRLALAEAVPALALPPARDASPGRQRSAALWLAAAWADGVHLPLAIAERPGLEVRLPPPAPPRRPDLWETVLYRLAAPGAGRWPDDSQPADVAAGLDRLRAVGAADVEAHVSAVLALVDVLGRRGAVPASHRQRPAWLRPAWGRWQREGALRQALDRLARSPSSAAVATATAAGRHHGPPGGPGRGGPGAPLSPVQAALGGSGGQAAAAAPWGVQAESEAPAAAWGTPDDETLPEQVQVAAVDSRATGREGQGAAGGGQGGAGPGVLGALHVVQAGAADRAAYWQLRGALAPQIERLIEGLRAGDDEYYAHVPRRFQRAGRLDRRRLPATAAGRERVFVRFVHQPEPAHALCLLLDCSASMTTRAEQLREMAIVVESATAAVGARVSAFTFGAAWERMEPAAAAGPLVALGRQLHPHGGTPFGPAVVAAAEWLAGQPYARKRLWVFSDGRWSARDRAAALWRPSLLRDAVFWVLGDGAPEPLTPAMLIAPVATVAELVQLAPAHFWGTIGAQRPAAV